MTYDLWGTIRRNYLSLAYMWDIYRAIMADEQR